ncbi:MAG: SH3 domain-containing protein [Bacteriovoracaceae bacterium]|jgi:hypothetical protein|nr:SH3 domain-containing protein [Bacteriovoracaceae bacterium]
MKKYILFFISTILIIGTLSEAKVIKKSVVRIAFMKDMFAHVHQNPSKYSTAVTTISCGHPVKIYKVTEHDGRSAETFNKSYKFIKVGPYDGYIMMHLLSEKRPKCFQDKYPRFFDQFEMDISEMYNWGRLNDLYLQKRTRVR